jgi:hypothetical protein
MQIHAGRRKEAAESGRVTERLNALDAETDAVSFVESFAAQ